MVGRVSSSSAGRRRGTQRERAVRDYLASRDWLAFRAPASLGVADVVALRDGSRPRLIEVKSTAQGPYESFGPAARHTLRLAAELAGADAFLAWWPKNGELHWLHSTEWPGAQPVEAHRFECVIDESAGQADAH
jgi:Holliday junction resolvase